VSIRLYIEGGGDSAEGKIRCREAFRKLLENAELERLPRLVACGGREATFESFQTEHRKNPCRALMLVDSEDPVDDPDKTWAHLKKRDGWDRPSGATDEQVLLMTTCMETWIVADRATIKAHYLQKLQESGLPATYDLENRSRQDCPESA
jgi:hypothetical protein